MQISAMTPGNPKQVIRGLEEITRDATTGDMDPYTSDNEAVLRKFFGV